MYLYFAYSMRHILPLVSDLPCWCRETVLLYMCLARMSCLFIQLFFLSSLLVQIYIGNLWDQGTTAVQHNADIKKDLQVSHLVAVNKPDWVRTVPQIGRVVSVPANLSDNPQVKISWLEHKKGSKTAIWLQGFEPSKHPETAVHIDNILLLILNLTITHNIMVDTWQQTSFSNLIWSLL